MKTQQTFSQRIKAGLQNVESSMNRLHTINIALIVSGIFGSAVSTLVAGLAAAQGGPVIGAETAGWRMTCLLAAVFSFIATLSVGLNQRLRIQERLVIRKQCAGRLRALAVALSTGSRSSDEIAKEYEEIVQSYPELTLVDPYNVNQN